jgi:hypothetical protein
MCCANLGGPIWPGLLCKPTIFPTMWGSRALGAGPRNRQAVWESLFWFVGLDVGSVSACLSLGRGTQRTETLTTICCVPRVVIALNVVGVKTLNRPLLKRMSPGP